MDFRLLQVTIKVKDLFQTVNVGEGHGLVHALNVAEHAIHALNYTFFALRIKHLIIAACLLHDVDDRKYFQTKKYENARKILRDCTFNLQEIDIVTQMISYVSFSANGNDRFKENLPEEMLFPCIADRLEALGAVGMERCFEVAKQNGEPFACDDTPRFSSLEELPRLITEERLREYMKTGKSKSVLDHFYDKLGHIAAIPTTNPYFKPHIDDRFKEMCQIVKNHVAGHDSQ